MTNIGPLTTTFTRPSLCETDTGLDRILDDNAPQGYYDVQGPIDYQICMPPGWSPESSNYYSPAPYCPSGFSTACSATMTTSGTETVFTCCPTQTEFHCAETGILGCTVHLTQNLTTTATLAGKASGNMTRITLGTSDAYTAHSFAGKFQATDITYSSSSSSLSTGAAAGIGVGVGLGGLLVMGIAGFLLIRKRRQKSCRETERQQEAIHRDVYYNTTTRPTHHGHVATEAEMDSPGTLPEMDTTRKPRELYTNEPGWHQELDASRKPQERSDHGVDPVELEAKGGR